MRRKLIFNVLLLPFGLWAWSSDAQAPAPATLVMQGGVNFRWEFDPAVLLSQPPCVRPDCSASVRLEPTGSAFELFTGDNVFKVVIVQRRVDQTLEMPAGTLTVTLGAASLLPPALPPVARRRR